MGETGEGIAVETQQPPPTQETRLPLEQAMVEAHLLQRQVEREQQKAREELARDHGPEVQEVVNQWEELPEEERIGVERSWLSGYSDFLDKMREEQPEKYQKVMEIEGLDMDIERAIGKTTRDRIYANVDKKFLEKASPVQHRNQTVDEVVETAVSPHMGFTHGADVPKLRRMVAQRTKDMYDLMVMEMEEEDKKSTAGNGSKTGQEQKVASKQPKLERPEANTSTTEIEAGEKDKVLELQSDITAELGRIVEQNERQKIEEAYYIYLDRSGKQQMRKFEAVSASSAVFLSAKSIDNFLERAREIEKGGGKIVGFFHNHPGIPSELESAGHDPMNGIVPNQDDLGSERFRKRIVKEGYGDVPMIIGGVVRGEVKMFAYKQIREIREGETLPYLEAGQQSRQGNIVFGKPQYADLNGLRAVKPPVIQELSIV